MSDKTPMDKEDSPIQKLFKRGSQQQPSDAEQDEMMSGSAEDEIQYADAPQQKRKGLFSGLFQKLTDILMQPDDSELMTEDDEEDFQDIFAEQPSQKSTVVSESPSETTEAAPAAVKITEEKETLLYAAEETPVEPPQPSKDEQPAPEDPKPVVRPEGETITRISLEDVLRVKNGTDDRKAFVTAEGTVTETPVKNELSHEEPVKKTVTEAPVKNELSHEEPVKKAVTEAPVKNELSHEEPVKKAVTEAPVKNELSHEEPVKKTVTEAPVKNELSHEEPVKKAVTEAPVKNELSHEEPVKKAVTEAPVKNELSHEEPVKKAVTEAPVKNELSHEEPVKKAVTEAPVKNELSHEEPVKKAVTEAPVKNELSHEEPVRKAATEAPKPAVTAAPEEQPSLQEEKQEKTYPADSSPFAEPASEPMIYKSDNTQFVVMAGKFTQTLRKEYEKAAEYRKRHIEEVTSPAPPVEEAPAVKPKVKKHIAESSSDTAVKSKKKKKHIRVKNLFRSDDYQYDSGDDIEDTKSPDPIEDYCSLEDADAVRYDIGENLHKVFMRTVLLAVVFVASVVLTVVCVAAPELFTTLIRNGWLWYGLLHFLLLAVAVFIDRSPLANGLLSLRKFKGNSDTASAVAAVAGVIQSVTGLFTPELYINKTYHLYAPLVILAMLLNSFGKLLIIKRTRDNFKFLCKPNASFAGKIYNDTATAERLTEGLPARKPLIAYMRRSGFMSNFLQLSYGADPVEEYASFISPFAAALSALIGIAYGLITNDFIGGVCSFTLTACVSTPMCSLIAVNLPMKNLCATALSKGAMIVGYETVKQFSDTNTIMMDAFQLYPKGSILLSGMKVFNDSKLNDAILAGAAVTYAVDGPMTHIFDTIIQGRTNTLPNISSVSYDEGLGLVGWSRGQRVLIGNRKQLEKHNIEPPDIRLEDKYRRMGNEVSYISLGGDLVAMFILTYKVDREIADSLRLLEDNGVSFVIRTIDCNITPRHIAERFSLLTRCIKVLSTGMGSLCNDVLTKKEKQTRAYLVTDGKLKAFASAIAGCIKIRTTVTIAKIIQYLSVYLGLILVTIISFVSGFAKLGSIELLIYIGFWCVALVLVSLIARKLSG